MRVTLFLTDGSEQVMHLSLTAHRQFVADYLWSECGTPTWGQYRDTSGGVHHLEFALITRFAAEPEKAKHE